MPYKNPDDQKEWWRKRRNEIRRILEEAKAKPCSDCGGEFHVAAMQFDHVRGDKRFNIGEATAMSPSLKTLHEEIEKCDIVCANCHAVRTYERGYFCRHNT